jgi:hypothetical protein
LWRPTEGTDRCAAEALVDVQMIEAGAADGARIVGDDNRRPVSRDRQENCDMSESLSRMPSRSPDGPDLRCAPGVAHLSPTDNLVLLPNPHRSAAGPAKLLGREDPRLLRLELLEGQHAGCLELSQLLELRQHVVGAG